MSETTLATALKLAAEGISVLPCQENEKAPAIKEWPKKATTDEQTIVGWFESNNYNLGIFCGGLVGIDVDIKNDQNGVESFEKLTSEFKLLATRCHKSCSGGYHYLFHSPDVNVGNSVGLLEGIDIRGSGGFLVAPPSIIDGKAYEVVDDRPLAIAPPDLIAFINNHAPSKSVYNGLSTSPFSEVVVTEGSRNDTIFRNGMKYKALGFDDGKVLDLMLADAAACVPPLPDAEVHSCHKSVINYSSMNYEMNDLGNVSRLKSIAGHSLFFVPEDGSFYSRSDRDIWLRSDEGAIVSLIPNIQDLIEAEAKEASDDTRKKKLQDHKHSLGNNRRISDLTALAKKDPEIQKRKNELDTEPALIGVTNGVLDLTKGELVQTDSYVTRSSGVKFDPSATSDRWEQFLLEIADGDLDLVKYLQVAVGYSCSGHTKEHLMFVLIGSGANGKSVFMNTLSEILGEYAHTAPPRALMDNSTETYSLADLPSKRLLVAPETDENSKLDENLVKRLTGGDTLSARHMYKSYFEFNPVCKVWLMSNHYPKILGTDDGIWRRLGVIPFNRSFSSAEQDKDLQDKLRCEASGILNWAIRGYQQWLIEGMPESPAVTLATSRYRAEFDPVSEWLKHCNLDPSVESPLTELYGDYCLKFPDTLTVRSFSKSLKSKAYTYRLSNGKKLITGISVLKC